VFISKILEFSFSKVTDFSKHKNAKRYVFIISIHDSFQ